MLLLFLQIAAVKLSCHFVTSTHLWGSMVETITKYLSISPHPHFRLKVVCKVEHVLYIVAILIMLAPYAVIKVNNRPTSGF